MPSTITDRLNGLTTSVAVKAPCVAVASSNVTLAGLQIIGAVLVASGDRVLCIGQTDQTENGIYLADSGDWTRAKDFDGARDAVQGTLVLVRNNFIDGAFYEVTTANPIQFGTSDITFRLRDAPNVVFDLTQPEIDAAATIVNYAYPPANVLRYGVNTVPGTTNMTTAIQTAINVAQEYSTGGRVVIPEGIYRVTSQLTISGDRIHFCGAGVDATQLKFAPTANGICLKITKPTATTINQGSVRDISIRSDDSTYTKTAIDVTDMSGYLFENIVIGGSVVAIPGSGFWSGGTGSIGIRTHGRDSSSFRNITAFCDRPLVISVNPSGGIQISLDHNNFHNLFLGAANNPCIEIESGCVLTQVSFTGYQAWVLGTGGLRWVDATSPGASNGLVIECARYENCQDPDNKYFVHIDLAQALQCLTVRNSTAGVCNGFFLRGQTNVHLDSVSYTDTSRIALNANATVAEIRFNNCLWNTGTSATLTGLQVAHMHQPSIAGPLPRNGLINVAAAGKDTHAAVLGGEPFTLADNATQVLGTTLIGYLMVSNETTGVPGLFAANGSNGSTREISDPDGFFSVTKDTATSTNFYFEGGSYVLQNKTGGSKTYSVIRFGKP